MFVLLSLDWIVNGLWLINYIVICVESVCVCVKNIVSCFVECGMSLSDCVWL